MAKKVFTRQPVASYFNTYFINFMVDAKKGEGIQLAEKYQVTSFPTYLFIDGGGTLIQTMEGAMTEKAFLRHPEKLFPNTTNKPLSQNLQPPLRGEAAGL